MCPSWNEDLKAILTFSTFTKKAYLD